MKEEQQPSISRCLRGMSILMSSLRSPSANSLAALSCVSIVVLVGSSPRRSVALRCCSLRPARIQLDAEESLQCEGFSRDRTARKGYGWLWHVKET